MIITAKWNNLVDLCVSSFSFHTILKHPRYAGLKVGIKLLLGEETKLR